MLCKYKNTTSVMDEKKVLSSMIESEKEFRSKAFSYTDQQLFQSQIDAIRQWPVPIREALKSEAKNLAGTTKPTDNLLIKAILNVLERIATDRVANGIASNKDFEFRVLSSELAMSTLFRVAPNLTQARVRDYQNNGKKINLYTTTKLSKLVVEKTLVAAADYHVLAYYCKPIRRTWLMAWAKCEDLKIAPTGNRVTDPDNCPWTAYSNYIEYQHLRPMSDFLSLIGIKEVSNGILFERPPQISDVVVPSSIDVNDFLHVNNEHRDDFFKVLGIDEPKDTPKQKLQIPSF